MSERAWRRIGVFGGTFDPPHVGHLAVAVSVGHDLSLDVVLFVVANVPWQKVPYHDVSPAADRLEMTRLAIGDSDGLEVSTIELDRGGTTYSADTLTELNDAHPEAELFLIVGADAAAGFGTWDRPDIVRELATTVIVHRPPMHGIELPERWPYLTVESVLLDISSSELRARVAAGRPITFLTPDAVIEYIDSAGLYGAAA